jgi:hypothetical protein
MQKSIIHKLLLARRLLDLAREHLNSANELSLAIGVNLLQDSVEAFLLAIAERVNAQIQGRTGFEQYIDLIDAKIAPKSLPFRARLLALNKLRVNSKHFGLAPAQSEVSGLLITVRELYDEAATSILGVTFASVSLIDLLRDGEARELVREAELSFEKGDFESCLFNCRKAIFVRIEYEYDVAPFAEKGMSMVGLALRGGKAPHYACNKEYIDKNVRVPTDYVVLDSSRLDMDLMRMGIDTVSFWNVWRLTPEVYRSKKDGVWVHKRDFAKLESEGLRERAEYVLDTTITMLASADQKAAATRWTEARRYFIKLKRDSAPLYEKATINSPISVNVPAGISTVHVSYSVEALDGSGTFWKVLHYDEELFLTGYLPNDEVAE